MPVRSATQKPSFICERYLTDFFKTNFHESRLLGVHLVSALTGYGIEGLVSWLISREFCRKPRAMFLIGSHNSGKSRLFNRLLLSDACKPSHRDHIHRSCVAPFPGTTLGMRRFPLNRPNMYQKSIRDQLLHQVSRTDQHTKMISQDSALSPPDFLDQLMPESRGHDPNLEKVVYEPRYSDEAPRTLLPVPEKNRQIGDLRWLYDTPGLRVSDDILGHLSPSDFMALQPAKPITRLKPRIFYAQKGQSLSIGSVAIVDFLSDVVAVLYSPFSAHLVPTADADHGSLNSILVEEIPLDSQLPITTVDLILSQAGWIGLGCSKPDKAFATLRTWTYKSGGVTLRPLSIVPTRFILK
ncbi:nitric oxide associated protein 1 [Cichlidogyrus casuarinus]|uniref:Nitric oxide associated protein 1 n=1 Tax=Cichlidogyrus casuarinus TaxID=1844966 RepID=A0ABD2QLX8_9PLAT